MGTFVRTFLVVFAAALLHACGGGGSGEGAASARPIHLTTPSRSEALAGTSKSLAWAAVGNAERYQLTVGTAPGDDDVLATGELPASWLSAMLPADAPRNQTLYARLKYLVQGQWREDADIAFTVSPVRGNLTRPLAEEHFARGAEAFTWTAVADTKAFYLTVGRSPGRRDVIDSGELAPTETSYTPATGLPRGRVLYARMWRKVGDLWLYDEDVAFQVNAEAGDVIHPWPETSWNEDEMARPFAWAPIAGATKYYLYVGTQPGLQDVVDSNELGATTLSVQMPPRMPLQTWLFARLHYFQDSTWFALPDVRFLLSPEAAAISTPRMAELVIGSNATVQWEGSAHARYYRVDIGSEPGLSDVVSSGRLDASARSYVSPALPPGKALSVRVSSRIDGVWKHGPDRLVTASAGLPSFNVSHPLNGAGTFDPSLPFRWQPMPGAQHYRLQLGSSPGAADIDDSGPIVVTERYLKGLVQGQRLYGRLSAWVNSAWIDLPLDFTVGTRSNTMAGPMETARRTAALVRSMAGKFNEPFPASYLANVITLSSAYCTDYANVMIDLLKQTNLSAASRIRRSCLIPNQFDCHTLVEVQAPDGRWEIIDPTFAGSPIDVQTGVALSVEQVTSLARANAFSRLSYRDLAGSVLSHFSSYYLDYPLLFIQPAPVDDSPASAEVSVMQHYTMHSGAVRTKGFYALRCAEGSTSAKALVDGAPRIVACKGVDRLSRVFAATSIARADAATPLPEIYAPRRYTTTFTQP